MPDGFAEARLLQECAEGSRREKLFADLFMHYRPRLRGMVELRLDPRVRGRIDPSDAVQEAYIEASRRLKNYLTNPDVPFYLWLRGVVGQKLYDLHVHHLKIQKRSARKEVSLYSEPMPEASSVVIAHRFVTEQAPPSEELLRAEERQQVQDALERMDPVDREVLVLRSFEGLSALETAQALHLSAETERKRYFRALKKLRSILEGDRGGPAEPS